MPSFPEALLNGWWQGIVLTLVVWAIIRDQVKISAATRLAIWQVTMGVVVLLPLLQMIRWPEAAVTQPQQTAIVQREPGTRAVPQAAVAPQPVTRAVVELEDHNLLEVMLVVGMILAGLNLLRLAFGYWAILRLKRKSAVCEVPLPKMLTRDARLMLHPRAGMAMAVGYKHPAIILPERMVRALTTEQLEQVVLHEAAHLERNDDWFALVERLIRAVFFVQPAIWFIGRQIERERELACDDWVVARNGESKQYAEALARVAEVGTNGWTPILATGAGRRKEIFTRMEALLDSTRNKIPAASEPLVLAAALVLVFVVTQAAPFARVFGFSGYDNKSVVSDGNTRREFSIRGDVEFSENEQDVASMTPGSKMLLSRGESWSTRRIEIEADDDGTLVRRYFVGGVAQPYGSEAKRFLAKELPSWMKNQSKDLHARLARWVQAEGVEGALREIEGAMNGGVKRNYLEELLHSATLDSVQTRRWLRIAEQLDSDDDKERMLELIGSQAKTMGLDPALIDVIQKLHSDDGRARLIERMLADVDGATALRLLRVINELHNDDHKSELLALVSREFKQELPSGYFEVAKGIHNEDQRKRVLLAALQHHGREAVTQQQVVAVAGRIHSEELRQGVVTTVLEQPVLNPEALTSARKVAEQLHDRERREALLEKFTSR